MNSKLKEIVANRTLMQTLGSGGVGKTTLSVVLGIAASRLGKKTLVITIDPSKRLMDTLRINPNQDISYVKEFGIFAMMIDVAKSWDMLLRRYASEKTYRKIINNRFNNYLKDYFPGFDEYIASEMIYHMMNVQDYDMIVVDSPPSIYAISYLEASNRVIDLLSNDFILSLIQYIDIGSSPINYIMKKEIFILKNIARFTGMEMLSELIKFVNLLSPLLQGFRQRASFIKKFYASKRCGFFIVTLPNDVSFHNTDILSEYLANLNYQLDGILINRLCSACGGRQLCKIEDISEQFIQGQIEDIQDERLKRIVQKYLKSHILTRSEVFKKIEEFASRYRENTDIFAVPEMTGYIKSVDDIYSILNGMRTL
ncbi:MAG: ArsA family ATPase [Myxococcota bacterium]